MSGNTKKTTKKKGIQLQEEILIVTTLLIGMVAGWYLYVTAFAPQFDELAGTTEATYEDFVVVGDQYGGRRAGATPSFQVLKDGSYNYIAEASDGSGEIHRDGTLPRALWSEVRTALTPTKVTDLAQDVADGNCASFVDGIDYTYTITLDSTNYVLDTCTTRLSTDEATNIALDKLWNYFATVE